MNAKFSHPFRLALLATAATLSAALLTGCNEPFSQTPEEDTTMLWPAADSTGYWGFINEKGEMVIPAKYDRTYGFSGGVAQVYIDVDGEPLRSTGYQASTLGPLHAFINKKGEVVYTLPEGQGFNDHYFYYGCCRFGDMHKTGMMDNHFSTILAPMDNSVFAPFGPMTKDGLATSILGYFNKKGDVVIPRLIKGVDGYIYEYCKDFCDGIAVIGYYRDNYNIYGAINTKGELVIDTIYPYLQPVGNDRLLYKLKDSDWTYAGLMDTQGNIITEPIIYLGGENFFGDGGLMPVRNREGMYGSIDKNGTMQFPYQYAEALPFFEGYAWVRKATPMVINSTEVEVNAYHLINMQGESVLTLDIWEDPTGLLQFGVHNGLCLVRNYKEQVQYRYTFKYVNLKGEVIYSWVEDSSSRHGNAPERREQEEPDRDEMMLRMFEGTKYYPLAEQCVRSRRAHAERE